MVPLVLAVAVCKMGGKSTRIGAYKCYECHKPFTVKIETIFESSHVPMNIWLRAMYLIAGSKKGILSNQLHRILGLILKTRSIYAPGLIAGEVGQIVIDNVKRESHLVTDEARLCSRDQT